MALPYVRYMIFFALFYEESWYWSKKLSELGCFSVDCLALSCFLPVVFIDSSNPLVTVKITQKILVNLRYKLYLEWNHEADTRLCVCDDKRSSSVFFSIVTRRDTTGIENWMLIFETRKIFSENFSAITHHQFWTVIIIIHHHHFVLQLSLLHSEMRSQLLRLQVNNFEVWRFLLGDIPYQSVIEWMSVSVVVFNKLHFHSLWWRLKMKKVNLTVPLTFLL